MEKEKKIFCRGGGCTAKLGPGILKRVLERIPEEYRSCDDSLLIGFETSDDAAVYQLTDDLAIVQTLDFFPPMVEDPFLFGQIAAANALSDVYAMGGEVKTALNIVCFPEDMDLNILGDIMLGGAKKVKEAGGVLTGGHSIADSDVKYGLSVTGVIHPQRIYPNNGGMRGDSLILTKPLGVGIIMTADRVKEASAEAVSDAVRSMTALNKYAAEILRRFRIHACTDVTGFGFLGHLNEMLKEGMCAEIEWRKVPCLKEAYSYAGEFLLTAAAQRNRNYLEKAVDFRGVPFEMEEILFDPQTSGGLLAAVDPEDEPKLLQAMSEAGIPACVCGHLKKREGEENKITVF